MSSKAVTGSSLSRLIWFLNLKPEVLQGWDRNAFKERDKTKRQNYDPIETQRFLFWNSDDGDTGQTLMELQRELKTILKGLLDPESSPTEALKEVLRHISAARLSEFKYVLTSEEKTNRESTGQLVGFVTLLRVAPPSKPKEGRRKPIAATVAISEGNADIPARQNFYRIVDDAIRNDTISEIRCCLYCKTFFVRKGRQLTYCSTPCETKFNNERRIKAGYFKDRTPKKPPAKSGYDVFLDFRTLLLQGSKNNSVERDRARVIAGWLNLDNSDSVGEFKRDCQTLDPEAHWRSIQARLKKRFERYAAI